MLTVLRWEYSRGALWSLLRTVSIRGNMPTHTFRVDLRPSLSQDARQTPQCPQVNQGVFRLLGGSWVVFSRVVSVGTILVGLYKVRITLDK